MDMILRFTAYGETYIIKIGKSMKKLIIKKIFIED